MKKRARNNQVLDALQGFKLGMSIGSAINGAMMQSDLGAASQSNSMVEEMTGDQALQQFQDNYVPQEGGADSAQEFLLQNPDLLKDLSGRKGGFSVGGETFESKQAAQDRVNTLNSQAMAKVYAKWGRPEEAQRLRMLAAQTRGVEQKQADDDELRGALSDGRLSVRNAVPTRNEAVRSSTGTGADITGASGSPEHQSIPAEGARQAQPEGKNTDQQYSVDSYLRRIAPQAVQTLLKQGRLTEARQFSEFVETEQGKAYAGKWLEGVRKHAIGDSAGALESFEKMYNGQLYNDGHTVRMTPLEDGKQYRIDQINSDGEVIGSKTGLTADLANQAAHALSPMSAVKFHAEQQAQREKEGALLDRQIQVKQLDAQRAEMAEDRRDERLAARLNADAAKREATGGLTLTQQRQNAEIDAAREMVSGFDEEEIKRLTAKVDARSGRDNKDYKPGLAKAVALAGRRKIGTDDAFDQQTAGRKEAQQPQPSQPLSRESVIKEFRSNRKFDNYTLGKELHSGIDANGNPATGYPVIDKSGRIVGVFN